MVALGRVVFTSREHIIALEPRGKGMIGITVRYAYEVRDEKEYFGDIPDEKITKETMDLASHIVKSKQSHFEPEKYEDGGQKIERVEHKDPSNVVNLMDALKASVKGEKAPARRKPARSHARSAKRPGRSSARHRKAS